MANGVVWSGGYGTREISNFMENSHRNTDSVGRGSHSQSVRILRGDGLSLVNIEVHANSAAIDAQTGSDHHEIGDCCEDW